MYPPNSCQSDPQRYHTDSQVTPCISGDVTHWATCGREIEEPDGLTDAPVGRSRDVSSRSIRRHRRLHIPVCKRQIFFPKVSRQASRVDCQAATRPDHPRTVRRRFQMGSPQAREQRAAILHAAMQLRGKISEARMISMSLRDRGGARPAGRGGAKPRRDNR